MNIECHKCNAFGLEMVLNWDVTDFNSEKAK